MATLSLFLRLARTIHVVLISIANKVCFSLRHLSRNEVSPFLSCSISSCTCLFLPPAFPSRVVLRIVAAFPPIVPLVFILFFFSVASLFTSHCMTWLLFSWLLLTSPFRFALRNQPSSGHLRVLPDSLSLLFPVLPPFFPEYLPSVLETDAIISLLQLACVGDLLKSQLNGTISASPVGACHLLPFTSKHLC